MDIFVLLVYLAGAGCCPVGPISSISPALQTEQREVLFLYIAKLPGRMKRLLTCFLVFASGVTICAQHISSHKIQDRLLQQMEVSPQARHDVYIVLEQQVDLDLLKERLDSRRAGPGERAYTVITALKEKASISQPALLDFIGGLAGIDMDRTEAYWIANAIFLSGDAGALASLAARPEVARILLYDPPQLADDIDQLCTTTDNVRSAGRAEQGLKAINAPFMWQKGYTGYGRKALIVDSGEEGNHPALRHQFYANHVPLRQAWSGQGLPEDGCSHGTHVTGSVVGLDRLNNDTIGVAFNAHWMGGPINLQGCWLEQPVRSGLGTFQWAIDPDDDPQTTHDMPDAVNNSWGSSWTDCDALSPFIQAMTALEAAGIAVVWAAGNAGPQARTVTHYPGYNGGLVNSFAVGNVNGASTFLTINESSSRGPSPCGGLGSLEIKPEVSAPGTNVRSSVPGGKYAEFTGTSMASPHVAGALLLLKEAFPYLTGEELKLALYFSARDLGNPGEDNIYGMGIIDLEAAFGYLVEQGHEPVPPLVAQHDILLAGIRSESVHYVCEETAALEIVVENAGSEVVTSLDISVTVRQDQDVLSYVYPWQGTLQPGERTGFTLDLHELSGGAPLDTGALTMDIQLMNPNGVQDEKPLNDRISGYPFYVLPTFAPAQVAVAGDQLPCASTQATLYNLDESPRQSLVWYAGPNYKQYLHVGDELVVDLEEEGNAVYATRLVYGGASKDAPGVFKSGDGINNGQGLVFDVVVPVMIHAVRVYAPLGGSVVINICTESRSKCYEYFIRLKEGENRIPVNALIEPGDTWSIVKAAGRELYYHDSGIDFPLENGLIRIHGGFGSPFKYAYFYDWEMEEAFGCSRTEVPIPVRPNASGLKAGFSLPDTVYIGEAPAIIEDRSQGAAEWLWDFGDGIQSIEASPEHLYQDTGTYTIRQQVTSSSGCTDSYSRKVRVEPEPVISSSTGADAGRLIEIFPVPASDYVILRRSGEILQPTATWILRDLHGKQLSRGSAFSAEADIRIPLAGLSAGMYLLEIRTGQAVYMERLMKM